MLLIGLKTNTGLTWTPLRHFEEISYCANAIYQTIFLCFRNVLHSSMSVLYSILFQLYYHLHLMRAQSLFSGDSSGMSDVILAIAKWKSLRMSGLLCVFNLTVTRLLEAVSDMYVCCEWLVRWWKLGVSAVAIIYTFVLVQHKISLREIVTWYP